MGNAAVPGTENQDEDSSGTEIAAADGDSDCEMSGIGESSEVQVGVTDYDEVLDAYQRARLAIEAMRAFMHSGNLLPHIVGGIDPWDTRNTPGSANNIRPGIRHGFSGWQEGFSQDSTLVNFEGEGRDGAYGALPMNGDGAPGVNLGLDSDLRVNVPSNPPGSGKSDGPGEETRRMFYEFEGVLEREIEGQEIGTDSYDNHKSQGREHVQDPIYSSNAHDGDGGQPRVSPSTQLQDGSWHQQAQNIESFHDRIEAYNTAGTQGIQESGAERQMSNNVGGSYDDSQHYVSRHYVNRTPERHSRDWIQLLQGANTEVLFDDSELCDVNNPENNPENFSHTEGISHGSNDQLPTSDNMEDNSPRDIPIRSGSLFHLRPSENDDVFGSVTERESTSDVQLAQREHQHDDATLVDEDEFHSLHEAGGVPIDSQTLSREDETRSDTTIAHEQEVQPDNQPTVEDEIQSDGNMFANGRRSLRRNRARVSNNLFHRRTSPRWAPLAASHSFARTFTGRPITDENGYVSQPFNAPGEIYVDPVDWDDDHDRRVSHTFETYRMYTNRRTRVRHRDTDKENIAPPMAPYPVNTRVASPNRYEHHEGTSREHRPFPFGPLRPVPSFTSPSRNINPHGPMTNSHRWYRHLGRGIDNIPEERNVVTDTVRSADEPDIQFERRR